ncbi:unnamed protein product, partial [Pylaiella littoralis]
LLQVPRFVRAFFSRPVCDNQPLSSFPTPPTGVRYPVCECQGPFAAFQNPCLSTIGCPRSLKAALCSVKK